MYLRALSSTLQVDSALKGRLERHSFAYANKRFLKIFPKQEVEKSVVQPLGRPGLGDRKDTALGQSGVELGWTGGRAGRAGKVGSHPSKYLLLERHKDSSWACILLLMHGVGSCLSPEGVLSPPFPNTSCCNSLLSAAEPSPSDSPHIISDSASIFVDPSHFSEFTFWGFSSQPLNRKHWIQWNYSQR